MRKARAAFSIGGTETFDGLLAGDMCAVSEDMAGFAVVTAARCIVDDDLTG